MYPKKIRPSAKRDDQTERNARRPNISEHEFRIFRCANRAPKAPSNLRVMRIYPPSGQMFCHQYQTLNLLNLKDKIYWKL